MQSSKKLIDPALLYDSLQILHKCFSEDCIITSYQILSEDERRNVIVRLMLHSPSGLAPASVILKQSLPIKSEQIDDEKVEEENKRTFVRFSRDWSGIAFVTSLKQETHNVPSFYGANHENCFILIEDLGNPHVSLVDSLIAPNRQNAVSALERYMRALGSFHAAGYGHTHEYVEILREINPNAPSAQDELKLMSTDLPSRLSEALAQDKIGILLSDNCQLEIQQVLEGVLNPGPFTVLTHGDLAPDNVFDHKGADGLQLIDFEACAVRNALVDGINFRFSMPTGWCAKAIPQDIIERAEKIYRDELCKAIPAAKDDELYKLAYTQACAFHLLKQLTDINSCLDTNEIWRGPAIEGSLWNAKTNFLRPRFISRLQTFIDVATENNLYPAIRQMAAETLAKIKELWPDAKPLDFYPAFNTVSLQSKASSSGDINKCLGVTTSTTQLQHVEEVSHNEDREGVKQVAAPLSPPNDIKPSISSEDTPVPTKSVSPSKPGK